MGREIEDLLQQATRQLFVRGKRCNHQASEYMTETTVYLRLLTCVDDGKCWVELAYYGGERCTRKGDSRQIIHDPYYLTVKRVEKQQAHMAMVEMTEIWGKDVHSLDDVKSPFHFYDHVSNQPVPQHSLLVIKHLSTLLGMFVAEKKLHELPRGYDLFYRIDGLRSRCEEELKKALAF